MIFLKRFKRYTIKYTVEQVDENTELPLIHHIKYGCKHTIIDDSNFSIHGSWDTTERKTYLTLHNYTYELIDMNTFDYSNDGVFTTDFKRLTLKIYDTRTLDNWGDLSFYDYYWDVFENRRKVGIFQYIIKQNQKLTPIKGPVDRSTNICLHKICDCE